MSATTDPAWSRDPVADANPDLPRKRERRSEENDASPLSPTATEDPVVVVEALSPEDPGSSYHNAIELHDEPVMPSFTDDFELEDNVQIAPSAQLDHVLKQAAGGWPFEPNHIDHLARWVLDHVSTTEEIPAPDAWRECYLADHEFFSKLGMTCHALLDFPDDLFNHNKLRQYGEHQLGDSLFRFLGAISTLSARMLLMLPDIVDTLVARKDSGQHPKTRQKIDFLIYAQILAQTAALHKANAMEYLKNTFDIRPKATSREIKAALFNRSTTLACLGNLLKRLVELHRDITNAWDGIDAILCLFKTCEVPTDEIHRIVHTAHHSILPTICEKHPRALPDGFHELLVSYSGHLLKCLTKNSDLDEIAALYDRYVKSDNDALLPERTQDESVPQLLARISHEDMVVLSELMATAWMLKALKAFIYSDIMDVRSCGISLLSHQLVNLFRGTDQEQTKDHPVLQYIARFMRHNELTKYIFGPNSHASIVHHSQNIIGFLAATTAYTNLETDIIWHACTNSVETEFVKASFGVLVDLCRYLDLDSLVYLANKYTDTPPNKLNKDAVDSLTDLFQRVQLKSDESPEKRHRLATAFISIDIMMRVSEAEENLLLARLREIARTELERFTGPAYSINDRFQIYGRCIPEFIDHTAAATTSAEILVQFLRMPHLASDEAGTVLAMLPVQVVVEELGHFIDDRRRLDMHCREPRASAIEVRIEAIVRLTSLSEESLDQELMHKFFRYAVGDLALSNAARDCTWHVLAALTFNRDIARVATEFLNHFLGVAATNLPLELTTPQLIKLFGTKLQADLTRNSKPDDLSSLLESTVWKKLVQTAETDAPPEVNCQVIGLICEVLFNFPLRGGVDGAKYQSEFVRQQIQRICRIFDPSESPSGQGQILRQLSLLNAVLEKSRSSPMPRDAGTASSIDLADDSEETESFHCRLLVYGGGSTHPKPYQVRFNQLSTVADLVGYLPPLTGTASNRVVFAGKVLDTTQEGSIPLCELGLHTTGVVSICPRHTADSDLNIVLAAPGDVEQEVLAHFDELEKLLDGSDETAGQVYTFLTKVNPPAHVRRRVTSPSTPIDTLCPPSKVWRTKLSFHVLKTHLQDFARLGVADEKFLVHGTRLLVAVITRGDCRNQAQVLIQGLEALSTFLLERPSTRTVEPIQDALEFVTHIVDLCFVALEWPISGAEDVLIRRQLAGLAVGALLQAFRRQNSVWHEFMENPRIEELYAAMIFGADLGTSSNIVGMIKSFCQDLSAEESVADFHLNTVLALLPKVPSHKEHAPMFFDLATAVLMEDRVLRREEDRVREMTRSLVSALGQYEHTESVIRALPDAAMIGLLNLLTEAISVLKSFKKPLDLGDLCIRVFKSLLLPPSKNQDSRPLVCEASRKLAFSLVKSTCEVPSDFTQLMVWVLESLRDTDSNPLAKFPGLSQWLRPAWKCSGLPNLGMTCYMNSLLQQLFANVHFRKFIFDTPILEGQKQNLLVEVQNLFGYMQDGCDPVAETSNLAKLLDIQTDNQEDVHGFYEDFLSRLEAEMPDAHWKARLASFFTGKLLSQIKGECGHISPKTEPFVDLPVIVKNTSCLPESLDEFVQGEPMQGANKYKCLACDTADGGRLVDAMRRACPEKIPDNLTFCLKRFTFEAMYGLDGKVNDRFEFPQTIDMSRYQADHLETPEKDTQEDIFELVGVIVHQGTLHLGHYWSYALLRNTGSPDARVWNRLEDRTVSHAAGGLEEVQRECFGGRYANGTERADNAYVLMYQRKASLQEQIALPGPVADPVTKALLPPRVPLPARLEKEIYERNAWRYRIAHLFDDELANFLDWLLGNYAKYKDEPAADSDSSSQEDAVAPDGEPVNHVMHKTTLVALAYLQRVAVCDAVSTRKLNACIAKLSSLAHDQPRFVPLVIEQLLEKINWFSCIVIHDNSAELTTVNNFILACLSALKEQDRAFYQEAFRRLQHSHVSYLTNSSDWQNFHYAPFLRFASGLAGCGPEETVSILDTGYWNWAVEILRTPFDAQLKKRYPTLAEYLRGRSDQVAALYNFISEMLIKHVDISSLDAATQQGPRLISDSGAVILHKYEIEQLFTSSLSGPWAGVPHWMRTARYATRDYSWDSSPPGRLLGTLVSAKSDPTLRRETEFSLLKLIELEEDQLVPILHLVTSFAASCEPPDDGVANVWKALTRVIHMWEGAASEFLITVKNVFKLAPCSVIGTLELWLPKLMDNKWAHVREKLAEWLKEEVYCPSDSLRRLDCVRAHQARKLAKVFSDEICLAYNKGKSRNRFEPMINSLHAVALYLTGLQERTKTALQSDDEEVRASVPLELQHEVGEIPQALECWRVVEAGVLGNWMLDLPMIQDVRRSVEVDDEDEDSEDWDDDDSDLQL